MARYCADCGTEVGAADNFCAACGFRLDGQDDPRRTSDVTAGPSSRWYLGVAVPLLVTVGLFTLSFSIGFLVGAGALPEPVGDRWVDILSALWGLAMLFSIVVAPVSVYFDREHLRRTIDWTPSPLYYLAAIPGVNLVVAAVYLWQRHRARMDAADT